MRYLICTILILMLVVSTSNAQMPPKPFNLYVAGGLTFSSAPQDFRDFHNEGYHVFGGVGLNLIPVIQFVGKVEYHTFSKDFNHFASEDNIQDLFEGGTRRVLMFGADARLGAHVPTAPVTPFLFAGIGLARMTETDFNTVVEDLISNEEIALLHYENQTDIYFNLGGGIEFKFLQVLNMFFQGKYTVIKQDGDDLVFIPVSLGIKF